MIRAKYIMHRRVAVRSDATGREISYRFMATGYPGIPVVNEEMEVIGIITEFDLLGALRKGMKVDEIIAERIMSKEPKTADLETPAEKLIEMMLENNFTVIPIVKDKKLTGIVSRFAVIDAYVEPVFYRYFEE